MGRLLALVGGVAWLGVMLLVASAIKWSERPRSSPRLSTGPPLVERLNAARPPNPVDGTSWAVRRATSAHNVLVVDVDAERVRDSRAIALQIVRPVLDRGYDEILVYVWKAGGNKPFADRRVQWTPAGGYRELLIGD